MWFAFQHGLKSGSVSGVPFVLWLVTGLFPWTFFSDSVSASMNSILEKSFLVKKMVFPVELLPLIKVIAASFVFVFLTAVMIVLFLAKGTGVTVYWLQLPYYMVCLAALVLSLSWITSAVVVFYRDLGQVINVCLQLGFWATPVFWNPEALPEDWRWIVFANPVNYVVNGFRDSLILERGLIQSWRHGLYFWACVIVTAWLGRKVYRRLRPHFADVL